MSTTTLAPSRVTARDPKGLKFVSIVEAAYNKVGLTDEEAQRVNEASGLSDLIDNFIAEARSPNKFEGEEVQSGYSYPREYRGPKPTAEQVGAVAAIFELEPGNVLEFVKTLPALPSGAEGWFAIPRWQKVAPTYPEAVQKVLGMIAEDRGGRFYNYRTGQIDQQHLRQFAKTARMFQVIGDQQKGQDILLVPCQLGLRHAGRSVRRAREVMNASEFGLDSFSVGITLLTHPERLQNYNDLWIDVGGDEFSDAGDGQFDRAPYFLFDGDEVEFGTLDVSCAFDYYGSASGFASQ